MELYLHSSVSFHDVRKDNFIWLSVYIISWNITGHILYIYIVYPYIYNISLYMQYVVCEVAFPRDFIYHLLR